MPTRWERMWGRMDVILLEDDILLFSKLWGERLNLVSPDLCLFILWFNRKVRWALLKCFVIYFSTECNEKHPTPLIPIPLLRVKHSLNGCCLSLRLKKLLIHLYMYLNSKWMNKPGESWGQIINREIKVYGKPHVWKSLATHSKGKLSFNQNLKIFYYLWSFVYKSMSYKIFHLKANIETSPNGEHKKSELKCNQIISVWLGLVKW